MIGVVEMTLSAAVLEGMVLSIEPRNGALNPAPWYCPVLTTCFGTRTTSFPFRCSRRAASVKSATRRAEDGRRTQAREEEGFYRVVPGQNPPEIAYWQRGEWWLPGVTKRWQPAAASVVSGNSVFRPS